MPRRLVVLTEEGCEVPFADMFDGVTRGVPFSVCKDDVLLLEGAAADIDPHFYNDSFGSFLCIPDIERDNREYTQMKRFADMGAKILGICKGAQFICVFAGGNLIQHVTGHGVLNGHSIVTQDGEYLHSSSVHHQMMDPFDLSAEQYQILAHTPKPLSKCYLDGKDREYTFPLGCKFVEPEIVWFPKIKALAIQGHPEYMRQDAPFVQYSRKLVERYLFV